MNLNMLLGACSQGLLFGLMAICILISFRFLSFADLTVEGSFTLGAAVAAQLIVSGGDPIMSTLIALGAGLLAGMTTAFSHTVLRIPPLLSGILTMTGVYSINLRIMGSANIPLLRGTDTLFIRMSGLLNSNEHIAGFLTGYIRNVSGILVGLIFLAIVIFILWWFFNTEIGYAVRATGNNEQMVKAQGVNTGSMKWIGLGIGNGCVALSGALVAQFGGFADVSMGIGVIVIGLASVIIGEVFFKDSNNHRIFYAVVLGSIIYRIIIAFVLSLGFNPNDFRLISAILLAIALSLPLIREKLNINLKKQLLG
jgi:putative ABC transport system permease protein